MYGHTAESAGQSNQLDTLYGHLAATSVSKGEKLELTLHFG